MAQPPPSKLSPTGFLSLPSRLCNPPPAVGKVRSCGVTPMLDVRLEDVLARRHLPPIGLKDLEEYLLYVEHSPENLYFILWLNDYTSRYNAWVQREKSSLVSKKDKLVSKQHPRRQNFSIPPTPDPALAMFYMRAKQTFFTPNGEYELNIPADVLAPFHSPLHTHTHDPAPSSLWHSQSVHPDPAVFTEVAIETRNMLNESLRRFVRAAYTNVGSGRAVCGIAAGCIFTLFAGAIPLILTTGRWNAGPHGRLIRLAAIPGLWFGLTVLIASLQGICLMIYIFGDLRQLRKFELARPTISRPVQAVISSPIRLMQARDQSFYIPSRAAPTPDKVETAVSPTLYTVDSPTSVTAPARPGAKFSSTTLAASCESCESDSCSSIVCNEIDVSPAFFDDVPAPEGPATASCLHRPEHRLPPPSVTYVEPAHVRPEPRARVPVSTPLVNNSPIVVDPSHRARSIRGSSNAKSGGEYGPTAGFIPDDYTNHNTTNLSGATRSLRSQRSARYFDFDLLPVNMVSQRQDSLSGGDSASLRADANILPSSTIVGELPSASGSPLHAGGSSLLGRAQYKCNLTTLDISDPERSRFSPSPTKAASRWSSLTVLIPSFTAGVPAFATPLTQIQSPVVRRAQWEVVVRAAVVSAVITGVLTGIVVGVVH